MDFSSIGEGNKYNFGMFESQLINIPIKSPFAFKCTVLNVVFLSINVLRYKKN